MLPTFVHKLLLLRAGLTDDETMLDSTTEQVVQPGVEMDLQESGGVPDCSVVCEERVCRTAFWSCIFVVRIDVAV
jgi:hypothetical protein